MNATEYWERQHETCYDRNGDLQDPEWCEEMAEKAKVHLVSLELEALGTGNVTSRELDTAPLG